MALFVASLGAAGITVTLAGLLNVLILQLFPKDESTKATTDGKESALDIYNRELSKVTLKVEGYRLEQYLEMSGSRDFALSLLHFPRFCGQSFCTLRTYLPEISAYFSPFYP